MYSESYTGSIGLTGCNFTVRDYATCNGQILAISQNQALFSLLGTSYGGDGRTSYGIPDLRGRVPVGLGKGPGLSSIPIGERFGMGVMTLNENHLPTHTHIATFTGTGSSTENPLAVDVSVDVEVDVAGKVEVSREDGQTAEASFDSKTYLATSIPGPAGQDQPEKIYRSAEDGLGENPGFMHVKTISEATATATAVVTGSAGGITGGTVINHNAGGEQSFPLYQPSLGVNYQIITAGLYPPRE